MQGSNAWLRTKHSIWLMHMQLCLQDALYQSQAFDIMARAFPEFATCCYADDDHLLFLQQCIPKWYQCQPSKPDQRDPCCSGSTCQYTYKGCPSGEYVCKPVDKCMPEGYPCGGPSGGCCCRGECHLLRCRLPCSEVIIQCSSKGVSVKNAQLQSVSSFGKHSRQCGTCFGKQLLC